ncbi:MAG TPA: hypothetical protein VFN55_09645 [Solirubrobacteraceae bacterium]|nr:hypothetical protein [Solirubrobacteraceae bacterium]
MRLRGCRAPILTCAVALAAAGCGTSAPTHKPVVAVTISTPTSGATLGVRQVTVTGTVTPAGAHVLVGGQPAAVTGSSFRRNVVLTAPRQILTVTARADGYAPAQADTTVTYSAALAAQMKAANRALNVAAATPTSAALSAAPAGAGALAQAVALSGSLPASGSRRTRPSASTTPSHSTPTPGTTPAPLAPSPGPGTTPAPLAPSPAPAPTGAPTAPAPLTPSPQAITERIRQVWEHNCLKAIKGSKVIPYCTCIYTHLDGTGAFRSPASVRALVRRVNYFIRTGDSSRLGSAITRTLAVCQSRYPGAQAGGGPSAVTPLSGTSHRPVPAQPIPSLPTGTTGTPTPVPVSPG